MTIRIVAKVAIQNLVPFSINLIVSIGGSARFAFSHCTALYTKNLMAILIWEFHSQLTFSDPNGNVDLEVPFTANL